MISLLKFLKPPIFDDEEKNRSARLLNIILLATIVLVCGQIAVYIFSGAVTSFTDSRLVLGGLVIIMVGLNYLMRRGYIRITSFILVFIWWSALTFLAWKANGLRDTAFVAYIVTIFMASVLLGWRISIFFTVLSIAAGWGYVYLEIIGQVVPQIETPQSIAIDLTTIYILIAVLIYLVIDNLGKAFQSARQSNQELSALSNELEQRVTIATRNLQLAAEIGRSVSTIRNIDELLPQAVAMIQERFDLYHTQLYLVDDKHKMLTLTASTGEIGQRLLTKEHRLPISSGSINAKAVLEKRPIIIEDSHSSPIFTPNPLLPQTRSEIAVPLLAGESVVGVLNLQSMQVQAFSEAVLLAFEALAGQLAIAIENANLFTQVTQARFEVETQARFLSREGWQTFLDGIHRREFVGYSYENQETVLLTLPEEGAVRGGLAAPITVVGETIGSITLNTENNTLSAADREIVSIVANQVGQRIESLRLLAEMQQYQFEAEEAVRRLTRQSWDAYQEDDALPGFVYNGNEVKPLLVDEADEAVSSQLVSVPLQVGGAEIGHLEFDSLDDVDEADRELLTAVARQLSNHMDSLRLSEQTEQALAGTEALYRGSEQIINADTYDGVLQALINSTYLRQFDRQNIMLFDAPWIDEPPKTAFVAALQRKDDQPAQFPVGTSFELEMFPSTKLFSRDEPTLFSDLMNDDRADDNLKEVMSVLNTRGLAIFPLIAGVQWIGVLMAQSNEAVFWNGEQVRHSVSLVYQAATVIQTIRLLKETQQRADRESLVNSITQKIQQTMTVENALETAVVELGNALQANYTQVKLTPEAKIAGSTPTNGTNS